MCNCDKQALLKAINNLTFGKYVISYEKFLAFK
jgi:hypothetical protein